MASPPDPRDFGDVISEIRRSKGLTQKQVADRISTYYSDERSYRRVEREGRLPNRDSAIAILVRGLEVAEAEKINEVLALAGYAALTPVETQQLQPALDRTATPLSVPAGTSPELVSTRHGGTWIPTITLLLGSAVGSSVIAGLSGNAAIAIMTSALYASLYAVSLLMESAIDVPRAPVWRVAAQIFSLMLFSSVLALVIDGRLASSGNPAALPLSLGIYFSIAALQWVMAKAVLPESSVVPLQFQSHTAQAAHLKNTSYFLVIVVLFWLPPFHCIAALQRGMRLGNTIWAKSLLAHRLLFGRDFVAFGPEALWYIFLGLGVLAIPMAVRLLENLKSHPGRNKFTGYLYLRAVLYFLLALVCLIWYSSKTGTLLDTSQL